MEAHSLLIIIPAIAAILASIALVGKAFNYLSTTIIVKMIDHEMESKLENIRQDKMKILDELEKTNSRLSALEFGQNTLNIRMNTMKDDSDKSDRNIEHIEAKLDSIYQILIDKLT